MTVHHRSDEWTVLDLTNFTQPCGDCGKTIRVVNGKSRRHWCRMPRRLRGKIAAAWAEGYAWGLADMQRLVDRLREKCGHTETYRHPSGQLKCAECETNLFEGAL